ncbi:ankyrin repeat-containing protein BDA1-like [Mangifera indica]|uniref:ankyrin repeat-containing protein BDA1-like n=1 Tax=Mangifera indica TaxID=29780 RepID=UPI001CFA195B|nr:ankyrin repeat-containing protein BDA1-like [Mangifera indica]
MEGPSSMVRLDTLRNLQSLAKEGDVEALFSILEEDPNVLERIDQVPFVTTPLHTAAREGKIHFAKEILNLKPSFARKRDNLGRSPLHLALEGKHQQKGLSPRDLDLEKKYQELVTWLIKHDSEVVRAKAKGMVTPLHYAAQVDDASSLDEFLSVCPSSIEELTVKSETAVHVAIKNESLKVFDALLQWLRLFNKEEILNWKDEEGNNALDTAFSANQSDMVEQLLGYMREDIENSTGSTALDICSEENEAVRDNPLAARAKRACDLCCPSLNIPVAVMKFPSRLSLAKIILKSPGQVYQSVGKIPLEIRNVLLVVATLVATATYQAALSPPGGYWQDDGNQLPAANNTGISNTTTSAISNTNTTTAISNTTTTAISNTTTAVFSSEPSEQHRAGNMILGSINQLVFLASNSLAFFTSVCLILTIIAELPFFEINFLMISLMVTSYFISIFDTFHPTESNFEKSASIIILAVGICTAYVIAFYLSRAGVKMRQRRV